MMVQESLLLPNMNPWRIYYDDGTIRNYTEGLPKSDSEKLGIQCVVQKRADNHYVTLHGGEYYLFIDGKEWISVYQNGLEDWAVFSLESVDCVIRGRAIPKAEFAKILNKAKVDADKCSLD